MKKAQIIEIVLGVVLVGLLVFGVLLIKVYRQPLAEPLSQPVEAAAEVASSVFQATATPSVSATATTGSCNASGAKIILAIGRDGDRWSPPYGADAIRVIKVDYDGMRVSSFAFPRDLLVQAPNLPAKYTTGPVEIGHIYDVVWKAEGETRRADIAAVNAVAQALYDNFGIHIDNYLALDETALDEVIDALGGVAVNVPADLHSTDAGVPLDLKMGQQVLDGQTAMKYVRYAEGNPTTYEWNRFERQSAVLAGLLSKLGDPAVYLKVPELYRQFQKKVITDLSPEQIVSLACLARNLKPEQVNQDMVKTEMVTINADGAMVMNDPETVKQAVARQFGN